MYLFLRGRVGWKKCTFSVLLIWTVWALLLYQNSLRKELDATTDLILRYQKERDIFSQLISNSTISEYRLLITVRSLEKELERTIKVSQEFRHSYRRELMSTKKQFVKEIEMLSNELEEIRDNLDSCRLQLINISIDTNRLILKELELDLNGCQQTNEGLSAVVKDNQEEIKHLDAQLPNLKREWKYARRDVSRLNSSLELRREELKSLEAEKETCITQTG